MTWVPTGDWIRPSLEFEDFPVGNPKSETKKSLKGMEVNVLGPARDTRSQTKVTRSSVRK